MRKTPAGFTLIELLIVIAIIGILAAIAIPNLLNAVQRGKQKRTMADMRSLATAIEAYQVDNATYPAASCASGLFTTVGPQVGTGSFTLLSPTYLATPPTVDGWGRFYYYQSGVAGTEYNITSGGRDGVAGTPAVVCGTTTDFNADIIYSSGTFIQWPEGTQQ